MDNKAVSAFPLYVDIPYLAWLTPHKRFHTNHLYSYYIFHKACTLQIPLADTSLFVLHNP